MFGGGAPSVGRLTADLGTSWNIDDYLAIKLWPGAHPLSGMLEAAVTAAREGNVEASDVAQILVAGPPVRTMFGSRRPKDHVEAIHSLPYFVASAIADKNFTWVHATADKIFDPTVQTADGARGSGSVAAGRGDALALGRHGYHRDDVGRAYHANRGRAARLRAARHRMDGCGSEVPRADAAVERCRPDASTRFSRRSAGSRT